MVDSDDLVKDWDGLDSLEEKDNPRPAFGDMFKITTFGGIAAVVTGVLGFLRRQAIAFADLVAAPLDWIGLFVSFFSDGDGYDMGSIYGIAVHNTTAWMADQPGYVALGMMAVVFVGGWAVWYAIGEVL
ncbi:hypothetical protein [Halorhabdus amylolytica]|uniref:hypothetical protein n=1 Tax=Halorhabdus amylolytica TaxID=2559573 RepID=UPI0010AAC68B|nr:hypothetical protein [Halorhabdus amylolytica]